MDYYNKLINHPLLTQKNTVWTLRQEFKRWDLRKTILKQAILLLFVPDKVTISVVLNCNNPVLIAVTKFSNIKIYGKFWRPVKSTRSCYIQ